MEPQADTIPAAKLLISDLCRLTDDVVLLRLRPERQSGVHLRSVAANAGQASPDDDVIGRTLLRDVTWRDAERADHLALSLVGQRFGGLTKAKQLIFGQDVCLMLQEKVCYILGKLCTSWSWWSIIFLASLLSTRFPSSGLSVAHFPADWVLDWSLAAKWVRQQVTQLSDTL